MLMSSLCGYSNEYILVEETITVANTSAQDQPNNGANKKVILKNWASFTKCIINVVMPMYDLIENSDKYLKASRILQKYYRDEPNLDHNGEFADFNVANAIPDSFNIKKKITCHAGDNSTKNVKTMVSFKYLSNFWRTLEIPLVVKLILICVGLKNCVIVATNANPGTTVSIADTELYVPVASLSTQYNTKRFEQLKSGFKRTIIGININQKNQTIF